MVMDSALDTLAARCGRPPLALASLALLVAIAGCAVAGREPEGQPFQVGDALRAACLVVASPEDQVAAEVFSRYVKLITGRDVLSAPAPGSNCLRIHIGTTAFAREHGLPPPDLHPYGYVVILVDADNLVITGPTTSAIRFGVYDFLHRFAGYRWFAPGECGEVIPRLDRITIPGSVNLREEPSIRSYRDMALNGNADYLRAGVRETLYHGHNFHRILLPEKFKDRPDLYAMRDGTRVVPSSRSGQGWQPCVSNPDLPSITLDWARDFFARTPLAEGFSACVNDAGGDCDCPGCKALMAAYGNQYVPFYNAVGELLGRELPGKLCDVYAYGERARVPPHGIRVNPSVLVMITQPFAHVFPAFGGDREIQDWANAGVEHLGLYDYVYGYGYVVPRHYPHLLGNAWKETCAKYRVDAICNEVFMCCWLYDGPRQYVLDRLAWNMSEDIDEILADYFQSFYCEAAAPMRRFFDRIEEIQSRKKDPLNLYAGQSSPRQFDEYTRADLDYLDACLEEARSIVKDPLVSKRLEMFSRIWGYSRLEVLASVCTRELNAPGAAEEPERVFRLAREACQALDDKAAYSLTPDEEKNIMTHVTFQQYKLTVRQEPSVESAVDEAFSGVWKAMVESAGRATAREVFADEARQGGRYGILARTQLYLDSRHPTSLVAGREIETAGEKDPIPVRPGERYRVSVWIRQDPPQDILTFERPLVVRWRNEKGWRDVGPDRAARVNLDIFVGPAAWTQIRGSFTVPEDVTHAVIVLTAPRRREGEMTWFRGLSFEKIYDPSEDTEGAAHR